MSISRTHYIPASTTSLKPLILKALNNGPLRRKSLFRRLKELAPETGFTFEETPQGIAAVKKALKLLRDERAIFQPQPKWYQISDAQIPGEAVVDIDDGDEDALDDDAIDEDVLEEGMSDGIAIGLKIERTVGDGPECV